MLQSKEHTSTDEPASIVQAGLYAANGHGTQSAVFVVITNKEVRGQLPASTQLS